MAWSGRPTHFYDFSRPNGCLSQTITSKNTLTLPICNWKAQDMLACAGPGRDHLYGRVWRSRFPHNKCFWPNRQSTNTTAGNSQTFNGSYVTNYVAGPGTGITYNPTQPIGQQFYATTPADISNDFYQVGQAINAALTQ